MLVCVWVEHYSTFVTCYNNKMIPVPLGGNNPSRSSVQYNPFNWIKKEKKLGQENEGVIATSN